MRHTEDPEEITAADELIAGLLATQTKVLINIRTVLYVWLVLGILGAVIAVVAINNI